MAFIEEEGLAPDELARLHALLLSALRQRRGDDPFTAPVTVAEIYQELVPYRSVRTALGIEMNADYEHTLLRLLSGERGLTRIEPQAAAEQLVKELESPNPNVTLYRKFAACDVWLLPAVAGTPEWLAEHLEDEPAVSEPQPELGWDPRKALPDEPATPATAAAKAESQQTASRAPAAAKPEPELWLDMQRDETAQPEPAAPTVHASAPAVAQVSDHCAFCDSALPAGRLVRFCPYCGEDQSRRPCAACGEPLDRGWVFCVACGEAVSPAIA